MTGAYSTKVKISPFQQIIKDPVFSITMRNLLIIFQEIQSKLGITTIIVIIVVILQMWILRQIEVLLLSQINKIEWISPEIKVSYKRASLHHKVVCLEDRVHFNHRIRWIRNFKIQNHIRKLVKLRDNRIIIFHLLRVLISFVLLVFSHLQLCYTRHKRLFLLKSNQIY